MSCYNFDDTFGYSFSKGVLFGVVQLSHLDKGLSGKIEIKMSDFSDKEKLQKTDKGILEFYDFNSNINDIIFLYKKYFDIKKDDVHKNLLFLKKIDLLYSRLYDRVNYSNRINLIYGIDFIKKDYTVYFRFYDLEKIEITVSFLSKLIEKKYLIDNYNLVLDNVGGLNKFFNYFYLKIKYIESGEPIYSLVINFDDFSGDYTFDEYIDIIRPGITQSMRKDLLLLYSSYKFTEVSFNLKEGESENIAFFDNNH